jgi:hypothetical protein
VAVPPFQGGDEATATTFRADKDEDVVLLTFKRDKK